MKFTIITPSYNQGKFIKQTVDSVINQTGDFNIEYFVMDGGSTDNTAKILKQTALKLKNNPKIKFYWQSQKDNGQVDAINQAIAKATGDIIAYINSDDYYLPHAFTAVAKYFNSNPKSKWLVGNCHVSDSKLSWTFWLKHIWPIQHFKNALYIFNTINQPSVFLKKSLVKKVGLFDERYHYAFDYDYWLRCLKICLPSRIPEYLSVFRIHPDSKGNNGHVKQFTEDLSIVRKYTNNIFLLFVHNLETKAVNLTYSILK